MFQVTQVLRRSQKNLKRAVKQIVQKVDVTGYGGTHLSSSIWEVEAGRSRFQGQPPLHRK